MPPPPVPNHRLKRSSSRVQTRSHAGSVQNTTQEGGRDQLPTTSTATTPHASAFTFRSPAVATIPPINGSTSAAAPLFSFRSEPQLPAFSRDSKGLLPNGANAANRRNFSSLDLPAALAATNTKVPAIAIPQLPFFGQSSRGTKRHTQHPSSSRGTPSPFSGSVPESPDGLTAADTTATAPDEDDTRIDGYERRPLPQTPPPPNATKRASDHLVRRVYEQRKKRRIEYDDGLPPLRPRKVYFEEQ